MTPTVTDLVKESQRKHELLLFGCIGKWQPFRAVVVVSADLR
jgi:hypothetical protein